MTMENNAPKVMEKDFLKEIRRIRKEVDGVNNYINFTYDIRPLIKMELNIAGTGSMDLEKVDKFTEDLKKITKVVKTFKYEGYELVYEM